MKELFDRPITYLITRGEANAENFEATGKQLIDTAAAAVDAGLSILQIREKSLSARLLFELTKRVVMIASGSNTRVLVNERADIAAAAGADGVHLRSDSINVSVLRSVFPRPFIIGVSTHSIQEAQSAAGDADFVTYGPVFATPGKDRPTGIEALEFVCTELAGFPVIALGGIDETNHAAVISAGAAGFASIRYLNELVVGKALRSEQ